MAGDKWGYCKCLRSIRCYSKSMTKISGVIVMMSNFFEIPKDFFVYTGSLSVVEN
jgi:hypothetical protein